MKNISEIRDVNIYTYAEPNKASGLFKFAVSAYDEVLSIKTLAIKQQDEYKPLTYKRVYTLAFKGYIISADDNPNEKPNNSTLYINFFGEELEDNGNLDLETEFFCKYEELPSEGLNFFNKQMLEIQKSFKNNTITIDNKALPIVYGVSKCYKPSEDKLYTYAVFSENQK